MSVFVIILLDPPPVISFNITLHQTAIFILTDYLELIIAYQYWTKTNHSMLSKLSYIRSFGNTFHVILILMMYIASTLSVHVVPAANPLDH